TCSLGKLDLHMFSYSNALLLSLRLLRPAWSLLFPYTTLFRSLDAGGARRPPSGDHDGPGPRRAPAGAAAAVQGDCGVKGAAGGRSEEHTSELQSRENLVCRLLLEKKKLHKSSSVVPYTVTNYL